MKPKQIKQALAARDLALQLGNYSDDRMRIEHKAGPPHEITIFGPTSKFLAWYGMTTVARLLRVIAAVLGNGG